MVLKKGLVSNYLNLETQLQPNGFDLTVRSVGRFTSSGVIDFDNSQRRLPDIEVEHKTVLMPGAYSVDFNEKISLPADLMGICVHRSSVMRCGAAAVCGFFDAGYSGFGKTLLTVYNPNGLVLMANARVSQMVFFRLNPVSEGYRGHYQHEGE